MSPSHRPLVNVGRVLLLTGAAIMGVTVLASCGSDSSSAGAEDATVLEVNLGRFVLEPAVLEAPAGDLVLQITNTDPEMVHDFVVHGKGTKPLAPGESQTLEIPDVEAGQYRMWCDMPGHAAAGQSGTLVVNPAAETPLPTY